jgi:hypothetical protein
MNAGEFTQTPTKTLPHVVPKIDPLGVLREVLDLARESRPELDVEGTLAFAVANPTTEVVDSLGAVSIVCVLFGAYEPDHLIPPSLLSHENFSTLNGLRKVVRELEKRQRKP